MSTRIAASTLGLALLACEVDLDAAPQWRIDRPRVLGIEAQVVELGPSWPERESFDPDGAPIVEPLPGDRVRLSGMVVDAEGRRVDPEQLDALWFQCFDDECRLDAPPCEGEAWTTSSICTLGRGGAFEFEFPRVGVIDLEPDDYTPAWREAWQVELLGIVGRTPEADAEQCRRAWASGELGLEACTIVDVDLRFGPRWVLLHDLAKLGVPFEIPLPEIPYGAFLQPANRAPRPAPPVYTDLATGLELEGTPPRIHAGQVVETHGPSWRRNLDRQTYVIANEIEEGSIYVFETDREHVESIAFVTPPLQLHSDEDGRRVIGVDPYAAPGIARVVFVVGDSRHAFALQVNELEVVP